MASDSDRGHDYWTPHRVRLFSQAIQQSDFPAKAIKALEPALADCRSVLDIGAGVGALTVPLAKRVERVTALEPSPAMADEPPGEPRAESPRQRDVPAGRLGRYRARPP